MTLEEAFSIAPVIAITRGVEPDLAVPVAEALYDAGVRIVEIPLNSPAPFESLRRVATVMGDRMICGSGTVLTREDAQRVADAGGAICVSPNTDPAVIETALQAGLVPMPGWATPTEALAAYAAGARWLKLFPAVSLGPAHLRQTLAILPRDVVPIAVGGVGPAAFADWLEAGAAGFGLGSELYRAGDAPEAVAAKAQAVMAAIAQLRADGALFG